jgi:hypothetical protein
MKDINETKRVLVSFTNEQWGILDSLRGEFGKGDAEIVRNIVLAWLSEKSFVTDSAKRRINDTVK